MPTKTALKEQQCWEVPSCSLPPAPSPNSWQRKQVAASSRLFLSFLFVTGVSVSNICWPELASSCCAGLWQGRAEEPGACAKHGARFAEPALSAAAELCLQSPGTGSVHLAGSARPLLPSPAPALSSGRLAGFCSLWIMNVILSKIAKGDKQINVNLITSSMSFDLESYCKLDVTENAFLSQFIL